MRFMVFVPAGPESEAGAIPDPKLFAAMGAFNEELANAGVMLEAEGLQPTSKAARLEFKGGTTRVIDGPFTESKELIAGFWMIQAPSLQDAIRWMQKAPFGGGVQLEIRPIIETREFHEMLTPELRIGEQRLRAKVAANRKAQEG